MKVDNNRDGMETSLSIPLHHRNPLARRFHRIRRRHRRHPADYRSMDPAPTALSLRQHYTVTLVKNGRPNRPDGRPTLFALPSNVGPRTMPDYNSLFQQATTNWATGYGCLRERSTIPSSSIWARHSIPSTSAWELAAVLSQQEDSDDHDNFAPDAVAGFNVNSIVIEVPITMLTEDGQIHPAGDKRPSSAATAPPRVRRSQYDADQMPFPSCRFSAKAIR